jgi:hypothetical protein
LRMPGKLQFIYFPVAAACKIPLVEKFYRWYFRLWGLPWD